MEIPAKEQRHVWERIAQSDGLDIGGLLDPRVIRNEGAIFSFREREVLILKLVPDRFVNPDGIARCRWKQIDHQEVNPGTDKVDGLVDKVTQRGAAVLVARRHDLDRSEERR